MMNRLALYLALLFTFAFAVTSCGSEAQNRMFAAKSKVPAVVAGTDIKAGEEFKKSNLDSKLAELYRWQVSMLREKSFLERRAARDIKRGEPITIDDILPADRLKWTSDDEIRNREVLKTFPGYENYYFSRTDIKKGDPVLTLFLVRRQVPKGGLKPNSPSSKTDEYIGEIPADAIRMLSEVRGKKANKTIKAKQVIKRSDLAVL